jgi:endoglucanase
MRKICTKMSYTILTICLILLLGCKKEGSNTLTASPVKVEFDKDGGNLYLSIQTDAASWSISNPGSDWLVLSSTTGTQKTVKVSMSVSTRSLTPRTDTLTVIAGNAKPVKVIVSQPSSDYLYNLSSNFNSLNFKRAGNLTSVIISTSAPNWSMDYDADWLLCSQVTGSFGSSTINFIAKENTGVEARSAIVTLSAEQAPTVQISVNQKGEYYPSYNISPSDPDASGMSSTAMEIANRIKVGCNIGNTLEATGGETAWGNPKITNELIQSIKQNGFEAIRLPCSWNQYADQATAEIRSSWLNRVKEVVQYCVNNDMYVILNIHWDGGWLENNCTPDKQEENNAKQKAFWQQIATTLRDFDEHLLFASANEPNVNDASQMEVLLSYHQTFIDAVRSTGGKNAYRVLVVQGPSTDIEKTNELMFKMPTDTISNRLIAEIHYYTPWNFSGMTKDESWGNQFYYWGKDYHSTTDIAHNATWGEEETVDRLFQLMKTQFVDKGIPVVVGEFGPMRRDNLTGDALKLHLASRAFYLKYVTKQAISNGLHPFFWDTGGLFNRGTNKVADQQALDALIQGSTE